MHNITYVVLHYKTETDTVQCIDSLLLQRNMADTKINIVIVDNGSGDGSGERLKKHYAETEDLYVLINDKNLGFACGNNVGYRYAKKVLKSDFIVLLNNDVVMIDDEFTSKIFKIFEEEEYYVLGPDIIDKKYGHRNPAGQYILTLMGALKTYKSVKQRLQDVKLHPEKYINNTGKVKYVEKIEEKKTGMLLNGACFIFPPLYVNRFDGLYEKTFLYKEEDCLKLQMDYYGYKMLYSPDIYLEHKGMATFKREYADEIKREIMSNEQHLNSTKAYIKLIFRLKLKPAFAIKWIGRKIKKYGSKKAD